MTLEEESECYRDTLNRLVRERRNISKEEEIRQRGRRRKRCHGEKDKLINPQGSDSFLDAERRQTHFSRTPWSLSLSQSLPPTSVSNSVPTNSIHITLQSLYTHIATTSNSLLIPKEESTLFYDSPILLLLILIGTCCFQLPWLSFMKMIGNFKFLVDQKRG